MRFSKMALKRRVPSVSGMVKTACGGSVFVTLASVYGRLMFFCTGISSGADP